MGRRIATPGTRRSHRSRRASARDGRCTRESASRPVRAWVPAAAERAGPRSERTGCLWRRAWEWRRVVVAVLPVGIAFDVVDDELAHHAVPAGNFGGCTGE